MECATDLPENRLSKSVNYFPLNLKDAQVFINCLAAQCQRHALPTELVLVEWNPPLDTLPLAEALDWPEGNEWLRVIIVQVPQVIHQRYKHAQGLPLYQMIAKNVGIRRSEGTFVLCTMPIRLAQNPRTPQAYLANTLPA